jgi:hypothetical protein
MLDQSTFDRQYAEDQLLTVTAFAIIVIAVIASIIVGKIKRQQEHAFRACQEHYKEPSVAESAVRDGKPETDSENGGRAEWIENTEIILRKPHSAIAIWTEALTKWTVILAVAGIFAEIFALYTLYAIRGQLEEMQA